MHITTDGIVLRERAVDEFDSALTLLTQERGVIWAYARGARKPRSALRVPAELLSYSRFVLFTNRDRYQVDKADLNRLFMGVRGDVERLSLAAYFCQITGEIAPHEEEAGPYLKLLLNTLYLLDTGRRECNFLKPVYELRLMTMAGYMPDLVACSRCGAYEAPAMYFLPQSSCLLCGDCLAHEELREPREQLTPGLLAAMRHILYATPEKLFQFTLPAPSLGALGEITQRYLLLQLDRRFDTLDFYLTMRGHIDG